MSLSPIQQFEAMFVQQMLQRLWATVPNQDGVPGSGVYQSLATQAVAQQLVQGGFTFGRALEDALAKQLGTSGADAAGSDGIKPQGV